MAFRGSKSRNKVSVGEPAEGSKGLLDKGTVGSLAALCMNQLIGLAAKVKKRRRGGGLI